MNTNIRETVRIIIAILILVLAGSCTYDATLHSSWAYTLPTTQQQQQQNQQQQRSLNPS